MIQHPGSDEAIKLGCRCPVLDNNYGKGAYNDEKGNPLFWYNQDCPIHGNMLTQKKKSFLTVIKDMARSFRKKYFGTCCHECHGTGIVMAFHATTGCCPLCDGKGRL